MQFTDKRIFCFPSNLAHKIFKDCVWHPHHTRLAWRGSYMRLKIIYLIMLKLSCFCMTFSLYLITKLNLKDIKSTDVWIRNSIKTQIIPSRRHLQSPFEVSFPSAKRALFTTLSHVYRDLWVRVDVYVTTLFKAENFDLVYLFMWLENEKKKINSIFQKPLYFD